jgi:hypothetical protein
VLLDEACKRTKCACTVIGTVSIGKPESIFPDRALLGRARLHAY